MSSLLLAALLNAPTILDLARQLLPFPLDQTQTDLLTTTSPYVLLNCHRQWGKTTLTALRALHQAISRPQQQIVVISPTLRQSRLLTHRCRDFARLLRQPTTPDGTNPLSLVFPNGSLSECRVIPTGTLDAVTRQPLYRRELHVRLIECFPLHSPFLTVLARVARLTEHPTIKHHGTLVADATGLSDPLVELIYAQKLPINFMPIKITSGQNVTISRYGRNVPKSILVGRLLHVAADAPQSDLLRHELLHFERKLQPGCHTSFAAGSTNHDDLVCALSLAAWWA